MAGGDLQNEGKKCVEKRKYGGVKVEQKLASAIAVVSSAGS